MSVISATGSAEAVERSLRAVEDLVLDEVLLSFPYNSGSQLHEYFGTGRVPRPFGGSCAWQSFEAGGLVTEMAGRDVEYRIDGRHVGAVHRDAHGITVLDPYLLHCRPLRLTRAGAVDGVVHLAAEAYPHRVRADGSPAPSGVRVQWRLDDDSVRLTYVRFSPRRGHNVISRSFLLAADRVLGAVPPDPDWVRPQLLHPEQHSVSVRVLHPGERRLAELVLPLAGPWPGAPTSSLLPRLISKNNQGAVARYGTAAFDRDSELVADAVAVGRADVYAFLLEAAALHRAAAPAGLELADYSLEDE
ncbi:hypothetical protein [Streptomyces sp. NBC_00083]|uniref:hypothetical protein n=1 Tax=Streptomyces sp. NBC_00083 TaxID=2975647 RepID=UPI002258F2B5|nr:hypothetical protein [Streptomyces sp. NBC_00083]MCX5385374.1 hypothetical protein [Streptomyces sp. NBC_00083]